MEEVTYNNKIYIHTDYILGNAPIYSRSCRSGKELIRKKKIDDYLYFRFVGCEWINTDGKSRKYDKVFVNKTVIENIKELNGDDVTDDNGIEMAPDIIELEDHEKFQDTDGNILDIETRGEKNVNGIYFKVKDVEKAFDMKRLQDVILDKKTNYFKDRHYIFFNCNHTNSSGNKQIKTLFITYKGLLKLLHTTRSCKTDNFIDWAANVLFTVQLGTVEDTKKIYEDKKLKCGISSDDMEPFYDITNKICCIYLLFFGKVKDLRTSFKLNDDYNDDDNICKYGYTNNLKKRIKEHKKDYSSIGINDINVYYYIELDNSQLNDAEIYFRKQLKTFEHNNDIYDIDDKLRKELIIVNDKILRNLRIIYNEIHFKYGNEFSKTIEEQNILNSKIETELRCKLEYETQLRIKSETNEKKAIEQLDLNNKLMAKLIEKL